jgi:DNA-binding transcriptional ArsR family regulator
MTTLAGFSPIAAALADPAREAMIAALVGGYSLPAGELAMAAGLSPSVASAHLQKLRDAGILAVVTQGKFRYYRLADEEVAGALEALANIAARSRDSSTNGSRCPDELRFARSCYTHLAGRLGVALADALEQQGFVRAADRAAELTKAGGRWLCDIGIAVTGRGPHLRPCLDWTERRRHFSGPIASALFRRLLEMKHLERRRGNRALYVTPSGIAWFQRLGINTAAWGLDVASSLPANHADHALPSAARDK